MYDSKVWNANDETRIGCLVWAVDPRVKDDTIGAGDGFSTNHD